MDLNLDKYLEGKLGLPTGHDPGGYDELLAILDRHENGPPVLRGILHHWKVPPRTQWRQWDTRGRLWIWVSTRAIEALLEKPVKPPAVIGPEIFALTGIDVYDMNDYGP